MTRFSIVLSVGPDPHEILRLGDLLEQMDHFEKSTLCEVIVVDDSAGTCRWEPLLEIHPSLKVRLSPRRGQGDPWRGGLITNTLFAFKAAFENDDVDWVLKLDTDSYVIRSFSRQINEFLAFNPQAGLVGSCYQKDLHGNTVPSSTWKVNLTKYAQLVRVRRLPIPHLETAFFGRRRRIRYLLKVAISKGWQWGACPIGGGYVLARSLFERWTELDFLTDDLLWVKTDLGEDVAVALLCFAAGFHILDYNQPGEVFGVQYRGLGFSPAEIFKRDYSVLHSVKMNDWKAEDELRQELRALMKHRQLIANQEQG